MTHVIEADSFLARFCLPYLNCLCVVKRLLVIHHCLTLASHMYIAYNSLNPSLSLSSHSFCHILIPGKLLSSDSPYRGVKDFADLRDVPGRNFHALSPGMQLGQCKCHQWLLIDRELSFIR